MKVLETAISDTIKNQSTNDLGRNKELLEKTQQKFKELVETRRKLLVSIKQVEYLNKLRKGLGCDLNNPFFKDESAGKVLDSICKDRSMTSESFNHDTVVLEGRYRKQLSSLAETLSMNGYKVYEGLAENALIKKSYNKKPQLEENSTAALFDDALHANSRQSLEKLQNRQSSGKADVKRFFAIFKEKFSAKCGELPDESQAQDYTGREEDQIKWFLHQFVSRNEMSSGEIDELEKLWNKKQAFEQENGEPVSDMLKKTMSDIFSAWRESLGDLESEKETMRTKVKLDNLRNELHKEYGDKYYSHRQKKTMDYIRVKSRSGKSEKAQGKKKYRYTIAGPSPEHGGLANMGDYSIEETTYHILEIGQKHLSDIFKKWQEEDLAWEKNKTGEDPATKRQKIDFLFRGHSRGAVGSLMGSMKLNYWIHNNYPQYADQVVLHLTQYDAVPGKFSNWGGYDKIDHAAKEHSVVIGKVSEAVQGNFTDKEYLPLGSGNVDTTMIYSMNTQYPDYFAAQEVRNVKRLIFTPFNHAVGLDAESTDASQLDQKGEKLHAVASKFNMSDKEAETLWNRNKTNPEVLEAAEDWSVFDTENKVEALADQSEMEIDLKRLKKALTNRRSTHQAYINKNAQEGQAMEFLKICTEVNYRADYVNFDLFVQDNISREKAVKDMVFYIEEFLKSVESIDLDALSEQEMLIVDTAADKVRDQLAIINSINERN